MCERLPTQSFNLLVCCFAHLPVLSSSSGSSRRRRRRRRCHLGGASGDHGPQALVVGRGGRRRLGHQGPRQVGANQDWVLWCK